VLFIVKTNDNFFVVSLGGPRSLFKKYVQTMERNKKF